MRGPMRHFAGLCGWFCAWRASYWLSAWQGRQDAAEDAAARYRLWLARAGAFSNRDRG
ncbi:MAG: hypothetical protein J0I54_20550 [Bosea sp.]|uniref:hypothetical protein n=1 Tax=unclassified Bosea (in: a-proteobacteria) TaxID=2653178 RepID=UPI000AB04D77|nr:MULTISPECIES: hypothetical protein [unclassified Bosea (in: a-proteobacteria)]MBN9459030.1 hypothetical protein [Bosea sp. (in: a-proteobacteria)]